MESGAGCLKDHLTSVVRDVYNNSCTVLNKPCIACLHLSVGTPMHLYMIYHKTHIEIFLVYSLISLSRDTFKKS